VTTRATAMVGVRERAGFSLQMLGR